MTVYVFVVTNLLVEVPCRCMTESFISFMSISALSFMRLETELVRMLRNSESSRFSMFIFTLFKPFKYDTCELTFNINAVTANSRRINFFIGYLYICLSYCVSCNLYK